MKCLYGKEYESDHVVFFLIFFFATLFFPLIYAQYTLVYFDRTRDHNEK